MPAEPRQSEPTADHQHEWTNGPVMRQAQCDPSPCSRLDDHLWDWVIQVQTCGCGETRKLVLGYENRRRRGDDMRRSAGKEPLGRPLRRSEVFDKPRFLR